MEYKEPFKLQKAIWHVLIHALVIIAFSILAMDELLSYFHREEGINLIKFSLSILVVLYYFKFLINGIQIIKKRKPKLVIDKDGIAFNDFFVCDETYTWKSIEKINVESNLQNKGNLVLTQKEKKQKFSSSFRSQISIPIYYNISAAKQAIEYFSSGEETKIYIN